MRKEYRFSSTSCFIQNPPSFENGFCLAPPVLARFGTSNHATNFEPTALVGRISREILHPVHALREQSVATPQLQQKKQNEKEPDWTPFRFVVIELNCNFVF